MVEKINASKRNFLRGKNTTKTKKLRLPWVISEQHFVDGCTQCGECINNCEENIIVKSDDGFPAIDFNKGECTFCEACTSVCKEDLFITNKTTKAWPTTFNIKDDCFAKNKIYCQSCKDVCDTRAISFHYLNGSIPEPKVDQDLCNSCGACIQTCPNDSTELLLL